MRVLIVKVSSLGDVIHTLPAVTDARRAHRDLVFDWVVEENFAEIPGWHSAVDKIIPISLRRWRKNPVSSLFGEEFSNFRKNLQETHYDLVIDAQGLIKSGMVSRLSRGLTVGLSNSTIREPLATLFYNKVYSVPWTQHAVQRLRELFSRALRYRYDDSIVDYGIDRNRICDDGQTRRNTLVFMHGTTWETKHWPEKYWRHLAHIATEDGFEVLLPWGNEAEKARACYIAADNPQVTVLEKQSLTGLAQHITRSRGVIAVDTGLGHLASALSVPALSLYGPTDPGLSGTFGSRQLHLRSDLSCAPCVKKTCTYTGPEISNSFQGESFPVIPPCFFSHKPELVWRKFNELIAHKVP
ncbi:MAG: lipopolysaccharide heptosyltransferase I [Pseudohongiellaceae bacterium]